MSEMTYQSTIALIGAIKGDRYMMNYLRALLGYSIHVQWEGTRYTHYSWTRKDAYDWMKQYPIEARVWITTSLSAVTLAARRAVA